MKVKLLLVVITILVNCNLRAQKSKEIPKIHKYYYSIDKAQQLYKTQNYKESAKEYKRAFGFYDKNITLNARYLVYKAFVLAKNNKRALKDLFILAKKYKYSDVGRIKNDSDFIFLHNEPRWNELISIVKKNNDIEQKNWDMPLVNELKKILEDDQKYRRRYSKLIREKSKDSIKIEIIRKKGLKWDSINVVKVKKILNERGWLGEDVIGSSGGMTLFAVIQHSELKTQLEYLPMVEEAVKKGYVRAAAFALLKDRTELKQDRRQVYGSQRTFIKSTKERCFAPLIDPENVDIRRASLGMSPIALYAKRTGLEWNVEKHKVRTAIIEAEETSLKK